MINIHLQDLVRQLIDDVNYIKKRLILEETLETSGGGGGGGAVDSVNGQTGTVTLDADDIDDSSTTNKFATAAELAAIAAIPTQEQIEDWFAAQLTGNTGVIDATYNDTTGAITLTLDVSTADRFLYSTGADTWAEGTITSFARTLLDDANLAAAQATLEVTTEHIQDIIGGMVSSNTETGIAVTYDDTTGKLNFDAQTAGDARYVMLTTDQNIAGTKTLTGPGLNFNFTGALQQYSVISDGGDALIWQSMGTGKGLSMRFYTLDLDRTDALNFEVWGYQNAGAGNRERLIFGWDGGGTSGYYRIFTEWNGTGSAKPIRIYTEGPSGDNTNQLVIGTGGGIGQGVANADIVGKHHIYDSVAGVGWAKVAKTAVVGSAQTVIPDGTGDVTKIVIGKVIIDDGTSVVGTDFSVLNNSNLDIAVGSYTLRIAVSSAGAMTVIRQSGSGSATVSLDIMWK